MMAIIEFISMLCARILISTKGKAMRSSLCLHLQIHVQFRAWLKSRRGKSERGRGKEGELRGVLFDDNALNKIHYAIHHADAIRNEDDIVDNYSSALM